MTAVISALVSIFGFSFLLPPIKDAMPYLANSVWAARNVSCGGISDYPPMYKADMKCIRVFVDKTHHVFNMNVDADPKNVHIEVQHSEWSTGESRPAKVFNCIKNHGAIAVEAYNSNEFNELATECMKVLETS